MSNKVLIIDDSETSAEVLKILLSHRGYDASIAPTARKAKDALLANRFDVVVIDYLMDPLVNGLQMLRWMRDNGIAVPAMIHSAIESEVLSEVADAIEREKLGPTSVVAKPQEPATLLAALAELALRKGEEVSYERRP